MDIFQAVSSGNTSVVEESLKRGQEVNLKNQEGFSPLCIASKNNSLDMVRILI